MKTLSLKLTTEQKLARLIKKYPKSFGRTKPLIIGIHHVLRKETNFSPLEIDNILKLYVSSEQYLTGLRYGKIRVNLQGEKVMTPSKKDIRYAKFLLKKHKNIARHHKAT